MGSGPWQTAGGTASSTGSCDRAGRGARDPAGCTSCHPTDGRQWRASLSGDDLPGLVRVVTYRPLAPRLTIAVFLTFLAAVIGLLGSVVGNVLGIALFAAGTLAAWIAAMSLRLDFDAQQVRVRNLAKTRSVPWSAVRAVSLYRPRASSSRDRCLALELENGGVVPLLVTLWPGKHAAALLQSLRASSAAPVEAVAPGRPRWWVGQSVSWHAPPSQ